ncbi:MAG TPA: AzlC family ABC transporter permease [Propionibacteriaceae bacterium]|nr:AzlC family ABC transporter permease [Propionibacteriaceae bacterium]
MTTSKGEDQDEVERRPIARAAAGIGLYAGAFATAYGAVAVGSGLSVTQAMVLSLVMFTGASQFAFAGVIAAGGNPFSGVAAALLLGVRNAFYGVPMSQVLNPRGPRRLLTAHFVIDETTAMAVGQPTRSAQRYAFWVTGAILFVCWQLGSLAGAVLGRAIDPAAFGLDAAAPAVFLALLWPSLRRRSSQVVALAGAALALVLVPVAPTGVPVLAAAAVALVAGLKPEGKART